MSLKILDSVVLTVGDATDAEKPKSLDPVDGVHLAAPGRKALRLAASSSSGSPSFTVDSISGSFDGTNWVVLQNFSPVSVTGNGEKALLELANVLPAELRKLRLDVTVVQLSASHYLTLLAEILFLKD